MAAPGRTALATRAISVGLLVLLVLTGCVWPDGGADPVVPTDPAPQPVERESPTPASPTPTSPAPQPPAPGSPPPNGSTVVYSVAGTGTASITYMTVQGGSVVQESSSGSTLPLTKTVTLAGSGGAAPAVLSVSAVGNQDTGTLSCTITQDGEVVAEQTATGPFATVNCSFTDG
jgi:Mycobacterium membrane protein